MIVIIAHNHGQREAQGEQSSAITELENSNFTRRREPERCVFKNGRDGTVKIRPNGICFNNGY